MRKYFNLTVLFVAVAALVVGSVWDYEIAKAAYIGEMPRENIFGAIFSYIGIIPTFVGWSFIGAGVVAIANGSPYSKRATVWLRVFGIALSVLSVFYFPSTLFMVNKPAYAIPWYIAFPIGLIILALVWYLGYKAAMRYGDKERLLKTLLILGAVTIFCWLFVVIVKELASRPRYRFVRSSGIEEYFCNWWQGGADIKDSISLSATSDELSSFPSGHSTYSAFAVVLFPSIAELYESAKKYGILIFSASVLWWMATAASRMTVGAHYLSDVAFGGILVVFAYAIVTYVYKIVLKKKA